jgi:hypothetical protein
VLGNGGQGAVQRDKEEEVAGANEVMRWGIFNRPALPPCPVLSPPPFLPLPPLPS